MMIDDIEKFPENFCMVPSKLYKKFQERKTKFEEIYASMINVLTKINESNFVSSLECVARNEKHQHMQFLVASSEDVWNYGDLEKIWEAVYTLQEFLPTEGIVGELLRAKDILGEFKLNEKYQLSGFELQDVVVLKEGLDAIRELAIFYDLKSSIDTLEHNLKTTGFKSGAGAETDELRSDWNDIYQNFNRFLDNLVPLEYRLYSPPKRENLTDHVKTISMIITMKKPNFKVKSITDLLNTPYSLHQHDIGNLNRLQQFSEEYDGNIGKLIAMSSVLMKMNNWFEKIRETSVGEENLDPMDYCTCQEDEILPEDPCFKVCDITEELKMIQQQKNGKKLWIFEKIPTWQLGILSFGSISTIFILNHWIRGDGF